MSEDDVTVFAHIAGVPVEETLLGLGPAGLAGLGAVWSVIRARLARRRAAPEL